MDDVLKWLAENWATCLVVAYALLNAAVAVTSLTPTEKDDKVVTKIREWLDRISVLTGRDHKGTLKLPGTASKSVDE